MKRIGHEMKKEYGFNPDYVPWPGETLLETIETLGMSQVELAQRIGQTPKNVSEIVNGKAPISPETALRLERVLNIPASFWSNLERYYQEFQEKEKEREQLNSQKDWLRKIPVKEMMRLGWIPETGDMVTKIREVLNFFGIASPDQFEALCKNQAEKFCLAFRKSKALKSDEYSTFAWLRKGEIEAQKRICDPYNKEKFKKILEEVRLLTQVPLKEAKPQLETLCASAGVAVVFVQELPRARVNGVARWLSRNKAVIQLSLRHKKADIVWFTFFHEAGHILKHGKGSIYIDDEVAQKNTLKAQEAEANDFASNILIPKKEYKRFIDSGKVCNKDKVRRFSKQIGLSPGIVVGRLHHDEHLEHSHLNDLRETVSWEEILSA